MNIDKTTLKKIKENIYSLSEKIDDSITWASNNEDLRMENSEIMNLKDSRMNLNRIRKSIDTKPVFALFGSSQVGKSYLVKNLLSLEGQPLKIKIGENSYDFLEKINPAGSGAESTGIVTRFTIDKSTINNQYPIKAKLLSIKDIVLILTDSFLNDLDLNEDDIISYDNFDRKLSNLETELSNTEKCHEYFSEDDIFEIRSYFNKKLKKENITQVLKGSNYWNRLGKIIDKLEPSRWIDIFGFYWNNNKQINELFITLNDLLSKLSYTDEVYLQEDSVIRGKHEILDVTRVKELFSNEESFMTVFHNDNERKVNTNKLSSIISEITLIIEEDISNHKEFIKNTDILDFPGARSREQIKELKNNEQTSLMYLRGKISYLFQKYSRDLEINNLLFCINDVQIEVKELPSILNDWININIGESIESRSKTIKALPSSPLFIIFTFFNNQIKYDPTNDKDGDYSHKWENRFIKFFKEGVVSNSMSWDTNWTLENQLFKNFYLLRDFKYSEDIFHGFEKSGKEIEINDGRREYLSKLKDSFLSYDFTKKHFKNPEENWDSASSINSDGSQLIIKNLMPSANNAIKTQNNINKCKNIQDESLKILNKYHVSDNKDEERNKIIKKALNISFALSKFINNDAAKFTSFIKSLLLNESEVYNTFHNNINVSTDESTLSEKKMLITMYPYLSDSNTIDENLKVIQEQEGLSNIDDVKEILLYNNIDISKFKEEEPINEVNLLIEKVIKLWEEKFIKDSSGIEKDIIDLFLEELKSCMKIQKLKEKIEDQLSPKFNRVKIDREDEIYFASVTTSTFNKFINDFGISNLTESTLNKIENILTAREKILFNKIRSYNKTSIDDITQIFNKDIEDDSETYSIFLENFEKWKLNMKSSFLNNCGYIDNEKNNQAVKKIITSMTKIEI